MLNLSTENPPRVLGVGSPLLDLLLPVREEDLALIPGEKGGMMMVEPEFHTRILAQLPGKPGMAPGGAAGNTIFALARLGVDCAMFGKLGNDANGEFYRRRLEELGGSGEAFAVTDAAPTGCCLSLITPDAERTMRSALGASLLLTAGDVENCDFSRYGLCYIEGYMFYSPVFELLLQKAADAGALIALDLASFEVVRDAGDKLQKWIEKYVDIVLANREEAAALLGEGLSDEEMIRRLAQLCPVAAVKLGREGALVADNGHIARIEPFLVEKPLDTTAAGDLWAAGFIYGMLHGASVEKAGRTGALVSSEVVKVMGSEIPDQRWEFIKTAI